MVIALSRPVREARVHRILECSLRLTDGRWADLDRSRKRALRDWRPFVYRRLPVPGRPPETTERIPPAGAGLAQCGTLFAAGRGFGPSRTYSCRRSRRASATSSRSRSESGRTDATPVPFVRTAPPASTRHVQPSDVCFHLAALPNFASSVVGPYRVFSHLSDTWGRLSFADSCADIARGIKFNSSMPQTYREGR